MRKTGIKRLLTVKLSCLFMLSSAGLAHASGTYAQEARITLDAKNETVQEVLEQIEAESGFSFFYNHRHVDLDRRVSISVDDADIFKVLDTMFTGTDVIYEVSDNKIVLKLATQGRNNSTAEVSQDEKKITGTVVDASGIPVIGANIMVKGTTNGTITDMDGRFSLEVPAGATLEVSYIGYETQIIPVNNQSTLAITLTEDSRNLEEVVVVGFGTQKKVNVIGSIAQIDAEKLENRATSSVVSALTGQMPGVTITQPGGRPGENTGTIRVRGVGSFGATPDALVLIDGIPGNMTDINPNDIESISVLKDASTAAIYGARAANGVVLVTTKMGKESKVTVSYNGYVGFNRATELPEYADSWDYARLMNKAEGLTRFTDADIQAMMDGSDPDHWANEKFVDDIFSGNGIQTGHDLSVTGGNDRSQYFASFGYLSQNGIVPHNNYSRYTARVNLTSNLAKNLKMTVRLRGDHATTKEPGTAGAIDGDGLLLLIKQGLRFPGFRPSVLSDGSWGPGVKNFGTPKAWLASESFTRKPVMRLNSSISLDYTPIEGLKITAIGAYNFTNEQQKDYKATLPVNIDGLINTLGPSKLTEKNTNTEYKSFQGTVNYVKSFNEKHNIDLLVGYSWEDETARDLSAGRQNFPNNNYPYLTVGSPDVQTNSGGGEDWVIQSVFGRAQYNYAERYLAEVTMRYDGSSRFPQDSRYAFFPSAALGWRISEERFIKENENFSFINNLKLKASIGKLGNNNIGNYAYQSVYVLGNDYNYPLGSTIQQGASLTTYTDPNLKWETTRTFDVGFESILWNGLLSANITYFNRYTYDILFKPNASASAIFGLTMSEVNTGEALNDGWEFELGHSHTVGDFSYSINANFSIINNEVKSLGIGNVNQPNGMVGNGSNLFVGYPMQMFYGYVTDGVFVDQADIDSWFAHTDQSTFGKDQANTKPGDIRYVDISGPDGVPDGKVDATYDRVYLGSRIPKYTFGFSFNAAYKGFDLSLFLQGIAGAKGMLSEYAGYAFFAEGNLQKWQMEGAFNEENPERYPAYPRLENLGNSGGHNTQTSDFWVRNANYLRIKNIQLGYTLPKSITQKCGISNLRVYVASENPYTFHSMPSGWDPEIVLDADNQYAGGSFYPVLRNFTFGVNLKF